MYILVKLRICMNEFISVNGTEMICCNVLKRNVHHESKSRLYFTPPPTPLNVMQYIRPKFAPDSRMSPTSDTTLPPKK